MAVKFGLSINAHIAPRSVFARKNYFYPDLPKGYQISQFEIPIVGKGILEIDLEDGTQKAIGITRAHLEEDAGKSLHEHFAGMSGIDLNRAGTPLLEILSEPDLRSAKEAVAYLKTLHHSYAIWKSVTVTCKKVLSDVTRMFQYVVQAKRNLVLELKSKT